MNSVNRNIVGIPWVCAIACCLAFAAPASAQPERLTGGPFSGLFKGSPKEQPHTFDLRGSAFGAWDDNVLAQSVPGLAGGDPFTVDPRQIKQGVARGFQAGASYGFHRNGTRSQFQLTADGAVQEFQNGVGTGAFWFNSYNVSTGLRTKITSKTSLSFGGGESYAPYYQYAPFLRNTASEESPVGSDYGYAVDSAWVRSTTASIGIENRLTKKSSISASAGWDLRVIPSNDDADIDTRTVRATFNHNLTRKLGFHIGYGIMESRYAPTVNAEPVRTNMLDIGLGYGDGITLTFGRHYTLSLGIGASIAKNGDPVSVATTGESTAFLINGSAVLARSIGRKWGASLGYTRGTSYMVGFLEPLIVDTANAGLGGPITDRLQFSMGAGASRGLQVFSGSNEPIVSYTASTRLSYAVFKHLGIYSQASYYRYSVPTAFNRNFGFVPDLDRRSVSVGLQTWFPLIKGRPERRVTDEPPETGQP